MIELTRAQARHLKAVLRRCLPPNAPRGTRPRLTFLASPDGLRVRARLPEVAAECLLPGPRQQDELALPGGALDDFEGAGDGAVRLERTKPGLVQALWSDRGVPRARDYPEPDETSLPPFPPPPNSWKDAAPGLRRALDDAARVSCRDGARYALQRLQLRGRKGEVVATDGRQVLIQSGFAFPWAEDVLVPALAVFGCKEVPQDTPLSVGRTEAHVCLRVGPWTFWLEIDRGGRFPPVDDVLPGPSGQATTLTLSEQDAAVLLRALPRLPGAGDDLRPVTVDLNGTACVRAREGCQGAATELELSGSRVQGPPVRFATGRDYLGRALALGFRSLQVCKPDTPVVCREAHRAYGWMPLGAEVTIPPDPSAVKVAPETCRRRPVQQMTPRQPAQEAPPQDAPPVRRPDCAPESLMPTTPGNGHGHQSDGLDLAGLVEEGLAIQADLRGLYQRAARLVAGLKRYRQQSRLVRNTLASLRQLQRLRD